MTVTAEHYSTDVEGGRPVCRRLAIAGRLPLPDYLDFAAERANWLSLDGWATADADGVTVVAAGPEALVGALEMALTLGPLTALVETIATQSEPRRPASGFRLR